MKCGKGSLVRLVWVYVVVSMAVLPGMPAAHAQEVPAGVEPGCWDACLRFLETGGCSSPDPDGSPSRGCIEWCRDSCNADNPLCSEKKPASSTTSTSLDPGCLAGICGDLNGDDLVSASDCQSCLLYAVSLPVALSCFTCWTGQCGDFNGDELVSASDCQACLLRAVDVPVGLSCDQITAPVSATRDCRPF